MGRVTTTYKGDMLFESQLGNHKLQIDCPNTWGGKNRGPIPPDLFISSIGSCVGVVISHFCEEHEIDITGLRVDVDYEVANHPTRLHNIKVNIHLPNTNTDDDCIDQALEYVAKHCPIYDTINTLERVNFEIISE